MVRHIKKSERRGGKMTKEELREHDKQVRKDLIDLLAKKICLNKTLAQKISEEYYKDEKEN